MVGHARQKHSLLQKAPRPVRDASRPTARMVDSAVGSVALGQSGNAQGASDEERYQVKDRWPSSARSMRPSSVRRATKGTRCTPSTGSLSRAESLPRSGEPRPPAALRPDARSMIRERGVGASPPAPEAAPVRLAGVTLPAAGAGVSSSPSPSPSPSAPPSSSIASTMMPLMVAPTSRSRSASSPSAGVIGANIPAPSPWAGASSSPMSPKPPPMPIPTGDVRGAIGLSPPPGPSAASPPTAPSESRVPSRAIAIEP
mmetsp:Transcript_6297/g.26153  ORF Transcript_6297/g.26153 Transcript_6297/m.26153 type:complete len:257 (-) Transcript_6297:43-813(-)